MLRCNCRQLVLLWCAVVLNFSVNNAQDNSILTVLFDTDNIMKTVSNEINNVNSLLKKMNENVEKQLDSIKSEMQLMKNDIIKNENIGGKLTQQTNEVLKKMDQVEDRMTGSIQNIKNELKSENVGTKITQQINEAFKKMDQVENRISGSIKADLQLMKNDIKTINNELKSENVGTKITQQISEVFKKMDQVEDRMTGSIQNIKNELKSENVGTKITQQTNEVLKKMDQVENRIMGRTTSLNASFVAELKQQEINQTHEFRKQFPLTCADVLRSKANPGSGFHKLYVAGSIIYPAYCLTDTMGGCSWTIVQHRSHDKLSFDRSWDDYKNGFGISSASYFIGLENLHLLTHATPMILRVVITYNDEEQYAIYDNFTIGNERQSYMLQTLGEHSGSAKDCLSQHLGMKFSTKDRDNDMSKDNCAEQFGGGWWYEDCYWSNLNGIFANKEQQAKGKGIHWCSKASIGTKYSLIYTQMGIRPKYCERMPF